MTDYEMGMDEIFFLIFFLTCLMKNGIYVSVLLLGRLVGWLGEMV